MGSFCSCFDADDPLDNTDNANNDNGIIPNLCNKIKQFALGNGETHPPTDQVAPNAVIVELGNTQSGTGTSTSTSRTAAATTSSIQLPPGPLLFEKEIGGHRYLYPSCIEEEECPTCLEEYTPEKEIGGHRYLYPSCIEEEECPTCLEEYTPDNPKITTKCSHHYHLACIYEWLERNQTCPICSQVMSFNDL